MNTKNTASQPTTCGACGANEGERCRTMSYDQCDAGKHTASQPNVASIGDDAQFLLALDHYADAVRDGNLQKRVIARRNLGQVIDNIRAPADQAASVELSDTEIDERVYAAGGRWQDGSYWVFEDADLYPFVRSLLSIPAHHDVTPEEQWADDHEEMNATSTAPQQSLAPAAEVLPEARRYCKGDGAWTDWQTVTNEFYDQHKNDEMFDFRRVGHKPVAAEGQVSAAAGDLTQGIDSEEFRTHLHVLLTEASFNESDDEVLGPFIKFVDKYVGRAVLARATKPRQEHPDDMAVQAFADAMKAKMGKSRAKGRSGWEECHAEDLRRMMNNHLCKGDPVDVGNFAMMLWNRGESTASEGQAQTSAGKSPDMWDAINLLTELQEQYKSTMRSAYCQVSEDEELTVRIDEFLAAQSADKPTGEKS